MKKIIIFLLLTYILILPACNRDGNSGCEEKSTKVPEEITKVEDMKPLDLYDMKREYKELQVNVIEKRLLISELNQEYNELQGNKREKRYILSELNREVAYTKEIIQYKQNKGCSCRFCLEREDYLRNQFMNDQEIMAQLGILVVMEGDQTHIAENMVIKGNIAYFGGAGGTTRLYFVYTPFMIISSDNQEISIDMRWKLIAYYVGAIDGRWRMVRCHEERNERAVLENTSVRVYYISFNHAEWLHLEKLKNMGIEMQYSYFHISKYYTWNDVKNALNSEFFLGILDIWKTEYTLHVDFDLLKIERLRAIIQLIKHRTAYIDSQFDGTTAVEVLVRTFMQFPNVNDLVFYHDGLSMPCVWFCRNVNGLSFNLDCTPECEFYWDAMFSRLINAERSAL